MPAGSWAAANAGLTSLNVAALAVDPERVQRGVCGNDWRLFKSPDAGLSWTPVNNGLGNLSVRGVTVDPQAPGTIYAATGGGVFKSIDAGGTWAAANNGLNAPSVRSVAINPQAPGTLYAGTTAGVFQSADGGGTWAPTGGGISETDIRAVVVDAHAPATVYAGTYGRRRLPEHRSRRDLVHVQRRPRQSRRAGPRLSPSGVCLHAGTFGGGVSDFATALDPCAALSPPVTAAVLPSSRSVAVGTVATAFATIINPNGTTARSCGITLLSDVDVTLSYQTTDPQTNQVTGTPDTPVDIPAGGLQTYVIAVTPTDNFNDTDVEFGFNCVGVAPAQIIVGVNTLLLVAFDAPPLRPDIVALAASEGGIVNVAGPTGAGVFAVATVNLGGDGTITASADTGGVPLSVAPFICETDPVTSICKAPPALTVRRGIDSGETPTYGIFVVGTGGGVPFDPAVNRIFVRFKQVGATSSVTRGSTSVAVRTQ